MGDDAARLGTGRARLLAKRLEIIRQLSISSGKVTATKMACLLLPRLDLLITR